MCLLDWIVQKVWERGVRGIGNPNLLFRWLQNRKACFALVLFADVVSIGPRVICQHDTRGCSGIEYVYLVLLAKTDMFVPV
jgi:hypothetical protein